MRKSGHGSCSDTKWFVNKCDIKVNIVVSAGSVFVSMSEISSAIQTRRLWSSRDIFIF
jgi:hypothetical protein